MICLLFILYCTVGNSGIMWSLNWQWDASKNVCWRAKNLLSKLLLARMFTFVCCYHVVWPIFHSWNTDSQQNVLSRSSSPHFTLLVDLGRIRWSLLLGLGRTGLFMWSSLFLVTMLRFTGRKICWKELHSLRCLSCAPCQSLNNIALLHGIVNTNRFSTIWYLLGGLGNIPLAYMCMVQSSENPLQILWGKVAHVQQNSFLWL